MLQHIFADPYTRGHLCLLVLDNKSEETVKTTVFYNTQRNMHAYIHTMYIHTSMYINMHACVSICLNVCNVGMLVCVCICK